MFAELLAEPNVDEVARLRARVGVMAIHGGIEAATAEVAEAIATAAGASLYTVVQPDDMRWHVPSTLFDPSESARLAAFLAHVDVVVSLHGFSRPGMAKAILLGGLNREFAERVEACLSARTEFGVVTDLEAIPAGLRGVHPQNPVNLPAECGVQVELSPEARDPAHFDSLVAALTAAVNAENGGPVRSGVG